MITPTVKKQMAAWGRKGGKKPKDYTEEELAKRRERMAAARAKLAAARAARKAGQV